MDFVNWLQSLGADASAEEGFQAQLVYLVTAVVLPVVIGLAVGFSLRALERLFGIELGKGAH